MYLWYDRYSKKKGGYHGRNHKIISDSCEIEQKDIGDSKQALHITQLSDSQHIMGRFHERRRVNTNGN